MPKFIKSHKHHLVGVSMMDKKDFMELSKEELTETVWHLVNEVVILGNGLNEINEFKNKVLPAWKAIEGRLI